MYKTVIRNRDELIALSGSTLLWVSISDMDKVVLDAASVTKVDSVRYPIAVITTGMTTRDADELVNE